MGYPAYEWLASLPEKPYGHVECDKCGAVATPAAFFSQWIDYHFRGECVEHARRIQAINEAGNELYGAGTTADTREQVRRSRVFPDPNPSWYKR